MSVSTTTLRAALRDVAYDAGVLAWSVVAFTVLVTGVALTASLAVLVLGLPVWLGFASAARGLTVVDRRLAGWRRGAPVAAVYRRPEGPGFAARLRAVTLDAQTWRDLGWMALTSVAGFGLGLVALTGLGAVLTGVSLPLWSWAADVRVGSFAVDTPWKAIGVALAGLALVPAALLLARVCASVHAGLAARVLGAR